MTNPIAPKPSPQFYSQTENPRDPPLIQIPRESPIDLDEASSPLKKMIERLKEDLEK